MRSPMVRDLDCIKPEDKKNYSDLQVLESGAGFYIGTTYQHPEDSEFPGMVEPGSRDSYEYYRTKELAEEALRTRSWTQRYRP